MRKLAEQILEVMGKDIYETDKLELIKKMAVEDIRIESLKATPVKSKLSSVITSLYKSIDKTHPGLMGYIPVSNGFAITCGYWMLIVNGEPAELLPTDAKCLKSPTSETVGHIMDSIRHRDYKSITVPYSIVKQHIAINGRKKDSDIYIKLPESNNAMNVFSLEYAFKLMHTAEITFNTPMDDNVTVPWYLKGDNWEYVICQAKNKN